MSSLTRFLFLILFFQAIWCLVILSTLVFMTSQAPSSNRFQSLQKTPNDLSIHPCNRISAGGRRIYTVMDGNETVTCHKLNDTELLSVEKCPGNFQQKFAAIKIDQAIENAENMFGAQSSKPTTAPGMRVKRSNSLYMKRGETTLCNCKKRFSIDVSTNLGRPCGVCASIYRQASSNRFPQFVNGVVCHPSETGSVFLDGQEIGRCVQETFTQNFLQWTGNWIKDEINSKREGKMIYKQEWETYTQTINSSCVFQFPVR